MGVKGGVSAAVGMRGHVTGWIEVAVDGVELVLAVEGGSVAVNIDYLGGCGVWVDEGVVVVQGEVGRDEDLDWEDGSKLRVLEGWMSEGSIRLTSEVCPSGLRRAIVNLNLCLILMPFSSTLCRHKRRDLGMGNDLEIL